MAKHRFTIEQRYAVYKVLGPQCMWCKEPVSFKESELDHIIPESLEQKKIDDLVAHYKLPAKYTINSFYNWAPIHPKCNKGKSSKTFESAPFIGEILHGISARVPEIEKLYEKALKDFSDPKYIAQLENALTNKLVSRLEIAELLKTGKISQKSKVTAHNALNCQTITLRKKGKLGKRSPKQLFDIQYQLFHSELTPLSELNALIEADAINELIKARENYFNYLKDYDPNDDLADMDSSHEHYMNFSLITKNIISYTSTVRFYHTGAAHEQYTISGNNYFTDTLRPFLLSNIIKDYNSFFDKILPIAYDKMITQIKLDEPEIEVKDYTPIEKSWLTQEYNAFKNYHFTETSLAFIFNPYEISAWSYGAHFPEFSFEELIELFPDEIDFINLIKSIKKTVELHKRKTDPKKKK